MADVPAWMLLAQTVLSGGIAAGVTFIVPRTERWKREAEQRAIAHATMRAKAEEIFSELKTARAIINDAYDRCFVLIETDENDTGTLDVAPFRALDVVTGLIATYYPNGIAIMQRYNDIMKQRCDPLSKNMRETTSGEFENRRARVELVQAACEVTSNEIRDLTIFMTTAVAEYHPTKLN